MTAGGQLAVGAGDAAEGVAEGVDPDWAGVEVGESAGVAVWLGDGVPDRVGLGDRVGVAVRDGLAVRVGAGRYVGVTAGAGVVGTGAGFPAPPV